MKAHYITCARSSSVDTKTNQISLFHVLDEFNAPAFPAPLASFCVAALFERGPDEPAVQPYVMAVVVADVLLASFAMQVDFGTARRNRVVNTVQGLTLPSPGPITIQIAQKTVLLAEWILQAIQTGPARPKPEPAAKAAAAPTAGPTKAVPSVN